MATAGPLQSENESRWPRASMLFKMTFCFFERYNARSMEQQIVEPRRTKCGENAS